MNDAFRREFQRVLPLCGSFGRTSQPDEAEVQPAATVAAVDMRSAKTADGGKTSTRLTTVIGGGDAGKNAAASGGGKV